MSKLAVLQRAGYTLRRVAWLVLGRRPPEALRTFVACGIALWHCPEDEPQEHRRRGRELATALEALCGDPTGRRVVRLRGEEALAYARTSEARVMLLDGRPLVDLVIEV